MHQPLFSIMVRSETIILLNQKKLSHEQDIYTESESPVEYRTTWKQCRVGDLYKRGNI